MELGREPRLSTRSPTRRISLVHSSASARAAARASTSPDQPIGDEEDAVFGDFVAGDGPLPEEEVAEISLRSQALNSAPAPRARPRRARSALRLDDAEPKTLEEIGYG